MAVTSLPVEIENQFAAVRTRNGVQPLAVADEGAPLAGLPDNIVGYTYSPVNESTPLYVQRTFQSFEVHKLTEGVVHVLGCLTPQDSELLQKSPEPVDIRLYPEPYGDAKVLVEISLERIIRAKPISRIDGNYMPLHVETGH